MKTYQCEWRHGPAPGLTYYRGSVEVLASSEDDATDRARRYVAQRGCFDPRLIEILNVQQLGD